MEIHFNTIFILVQNRAIGETILKTGSVPIIGHFVSKNVSKNAQSKEFSLDSLFQKKTVIMNKDFASSNFNHSRKCSDQTMMHGLGTIPRKLSFLSLNCCFGRKITKMITTDIYELALYMIFKKFHQYKVGCTFCRRLYSTPCRIRMG